MHLIFSAYRLFLFLVPFVALCSFSRAEAVAGGSKELHTHVMARGGGALAAPREGAVVIATEAAYPPFSFTKKTGRITGFEIELTQAACVLEGLECHFLNQPFDALIPGLMAKKYQAIVGGISVTPEREKEVAFTDVYYQPEFGFIVHASAKKKMNFTKGGMADFAIATQRGTTFEYFLKTYFSQRATVMLYDSFEGAFLDLGSGRAQAVMADLPTLKAFSKRSPGEYAIELATPDMKAYLKGGFALGFRPDAEGTALRDVFNRAMNELQKNGTYERLSKKWLE